MKRNILKELLSDAYDAWFADQLSGAAYREMSELIMAKADELAECGAITSAELARIVDEHSSNLLLIDDVIVP